MVNDSSRQRHLLALALRVAVRTYAHGGRRGAPACWRDGNSRLGASRVAPSRTQSAATLSGRLRCNIVVSLIRCDRHPRPRLCSSTDCPHSSCSFGHGGSGRDASRPPAHRQPRARPESDYRRGFGYTRARCRGRVAAQAHFLAPRTAAANEPPTRSRVSIAATARPGQVPLRCELQLEPGALQVRRPRRHGKPPTTSHAFRQ